MVDNQGNTYTPLEGRRPIDSPETDIPPRDANLCVYIGLVMAGIGFVLPYNRLVFCIKIFDVVTIITTHNIHYTIKRIAICIHRYIHLCIG